MTSGHTEPNEHSEHPNRGYIIPIGGAEDKVSDARILRRFAGICGGSRAKIAIIPTASQLEETGPTYARIFEEMGIEKATVLPMETRADGDDEAYLEVLEEADGLFMTGGNQLRLSTTLGGTGTARMIRRRNHEGMHVAGTSAGASFMSAHMIAFGQEGPTPHSDMVTLAPGLGLTNSVIVDQHFRQRDRFGRLLTALAYNPFAVGLGLDEDTAFFLDAENNLEVMGSGGITIVDPSELEYSSMDSAKQSDPVCLIGVRVHILTEGATYQVKTRKAGPPQ